MLLCSLFGLLGGGKPVAVSVQLEYHAVVNEAIDGCGCSHRVLEDLFPLAEWQVARQHDTCTLVAISQKREEHFHLLATLLNVANIVDHQRVEATEALQHAAELEITLGDQKVLD